jgi:hypothetical protein
LKWLLTRQEQDTKVNQWCISLQSSTWHMLQEAQGSKKGKGKAKAKAIEPGVWWSTKSKGLN